MINFQKELNSEQLKVVEQGEGPCLVLAGAGSGKTRTITYRVAYLLEQGVKPENILLVTFTNKAAKEMIERVKKIIGNDLKLPWSGTFHHIGYRILKKYAEVLGYKNNFSVLDADDSLELIKLCLKAEGIDRKEKRFPSAKVLQTIISFARNAEMSLEEVLELKYENFLAISDILVRLAEDYHKRKQEANVMDFDDLLVNLYLLFLKNPVIKNKYAEQFQYILVDEYQDTNKIQASIIELLATKHKNLLVVGDDAQSIYSFRAADINNILEFSTLGEFTLNRKGKYPNAKIFKLETNYRSTPNILNVANCVIANNRKQYEKKLKSVVKEFAKPEIYSFADQAEEADFIVNQIFELQAEGVNLNNIAILFRAAYQSQALEMELTKQGINYDYRGGIRFFERAHIKDVLSYLRIFNNLEDDISWRRVLNLQIGIGPVTVEKIIRMIKTFSGEEKNKEKVREEKINSTSLMTMLKNFSYLERNFENIKTQLSAKAQIGWNDFLQVYFEIKEIIESEEKCSIGDLIRVLIKSKYKEYLENEYLDYRERIQDLEQLALFADQTEDLSQFLAEATLQENFQRIDKEEISAEDLENKIILSTIHQAKGLEWEAVFVIGLTSGQFPNDRAIREQGLEEERRLFYVAITRAKKYLYLTYALTGGFFVQSSATLGGAGFLQEPSMFIDEIDKDLIFDNSFKEGNVFFDDEEIEYITDDNSPFDPGSFLKRISDL